MPEIIFNQNQVLQGTIFIIYSYCKYNKLYVHQILWSLNHYFRHKYLHAAVTFYTYLLGIPSYDMVIMAWNADIMFLQYLY